MTKPNFTVTLYQLTLGDQDPVTGQFRVGYTILTMKMPIFPKGSSATLQIVGHYARHDAMGFTNYAVEEGDAVQTVAGENYRVLARRSVTEGNVFVMYECDLAKLMMLPVLIPSTPGSTFYGFEIISSTDKFEDGFERGYYVT